MKYKWLVRYNKTEIAAFVSDTDLNLFLNAEPLDNVQEILEIKVVREIAVPSIDIGSGDTITIRKAGANDKV